MARKSMSRETLLPRMAEFVLQHGLSNASLRPLAEAAGTSDRMLLYHFRSKEDLLVELLAYLADDYAGLLDAVFEEAAAPSRRTCVERIHSFSDQPEAAPYLALWWEIVAGSARDLPGYRAAAQRVMQRMLDWLEQNMPGGDPDPVEGARLLLTLIEGAQMLRAVGRGDIANAGIAAFPT